MMWKKRKKEYMQIKLIGTDFNRIKGMGHVEKIAYIAILSLVFFEKGR